jgi:diguanylate cyclase (GGDEF)-like protein
VVSRAIVTTAVVGVVVAAWAAVAGAVLGRAVWTVAVAAGLASALIAVAVLEYRRLRRAVLEPIDGLVRDVERYDDGVRLDPVSSGPDEVRRLAGGMRRMSVRLDDAAASVRQRDERLADYDDDVDVIVRMARRLCGSFDLGFILRTIGIAALELTRLPRAVVWMTDGDRLVARYDSGAPQVLSAARAPVELGSGRVGSAALTNSPVVDDGLQPGAAPGIAVPLDSRGTVVGVVELIGSGVVDLSSRQRRLLAVLAGHAATAVDASDVEARAEQLERTDASTGLANYRQFVSDLNTEVMRCNRYGRPLALIIADIDGFRAFNERYGRTRGDQVLSVLAGLLETEARASDSAYRFGGDEFVVVAREVHGEAVRSLAERIGVQFRSQLEELTPGAELTVSFGIGDLSTAADGAQLVGRADDALIRAKALGYNRVVVAGAGGVGGRPAMAATRVSGPDGSGDGPGNP